MIEVPVYNQDGQPMQSMQIDESLLGGKVRIRLLKQAIVMYEANARQGSVAKKSRGQVQGSTRKIYKQKHTGNARMGPVRSPVRKGGGVAFQQVPRDYDKDMPEKMRRLARANAVLAKLLDKQVMIVDDLSFQEPKTKQFTKLLKNLKVSDATCLLVLANHSEVIWKSGRNLEGVAVKVVAQMDPWNVLRHHFVVFTKDAFAAFAANPMNPAAALASAPAAA